MRKLALVSGTGPAGIGLAMRFAKAGDEVIIGSRSLEKAQKTREQVLEAVPGANVSAAENRDAVAAGEVVLLTMLADAQRKSVEGLVDVLADKIVVSMANPVTVEDGKVTTVLPAAGSLAQEVQDLVPTARVVGALHEVHVKRFAKLDKPIKVDTIITGDDEAAKKEVTELVREIEGLRPIDGGPLSNTGLVEGFVGVLVSVNLIYKAGTSFHLTGLPEGV